MANPEHLSKIRESVDVEVWNHWRKRNAEVKPDLSGANLSEANLSKINLSEACLIGADLNLADLIGADLSLANLIGTKLIGAHLRNANLIGAYLRNANLIGADLQNANLTGANLCGVDLTGANLMGANLTGVDLTGAISEDWHRIRATQLDNIQCGYIFRKRAPETGKPTARLPVDPDSTFAPGEFVRRFQMSSNTRKTLDLMFPDGIDWQAFLASFQRLRQQCPNAKISIQGLEHKDETFVVRLEVIQEADPQKLKGQVKQLYETQLQVLEAHYEQQLRLQGAPPTEVRQLIEAERRQQTTLINVVEAMVNNQQGSQYTVPQAKLASVLAETVQDD